MVFLILGFTGVWNPLKNLISPTNVDSTIEDCNSICGLDQKYSFCSADRTLRVNEEKFEVKTSCFVLANFPTFTKYNIQKCPAITCDLPCGQISINSKVGTAVSSGTAGKYDVTALATGLQTGQICIIN